MDSKKHIVFFCEHLFLGGAPQAQVEFLRGIDLDRYDVSLVVEQDPGPDNHLLAQIPPAIPVRVLFPKNDTNFPQDNIGFFWGFIRRRSEKIDTILRIKEVLKGLRKADVLIGFTLTFAKVLPVFKKYKLIYWIHGPKSHMGPTELFKFYQRIRHFDRIVVVSEFLELQIKDLLPKLADKIKAIYTPIDFESVARKAHDFSELSEFEKELIQQKFYVAVARFVPEKDIECLVRSWSLLKQQGFPPNLVVVGDGQGRSSIENLVRDLKVEDKVFLVGAKKNPFIWMSQSIAFVHAAKSEGFGLVLVEAMSLGKAVISSDCPVGPSEILQNGQCGLLVKVGDERDFADKILQIDQNSKLRSEMENLALIRAKDFSSEKVLPDFYQLIESL